MDESSDTAFAKTETKPDPFSIFYTKRPTKKSALADWKRIALNRGTSGLRVEHHTQRIIVAFKPPEDYSKEHLREIREKQVRARYRLKLYVENRQEIIAMIPEAP